eukprot:TRINITY_DN10616_c0_g1_i1.p2 TRINITY_DN10616_c0_g1~~TRINITY_DN10616_c0_g1_i1.p2  ORF type:complete len:357 (+),score=62.45 TRINITY_DN10616_c0_g1_i1:52-1071(+)
MEARSFAKFKLRRIYKENHNHDITHMTFNRASKGFCNNLVATVSEDQVFVYDNAHRGDNFDVMLNFVHQKTDYVTGAALKTCEWITGTQEDATLAVAGQEHIIQIISVARTRVSKLLTGHSGDVTSLRRHPTDSNQLLSSAVDGVKLWNIRDGKPTSISTTTAIDSCFAQDNIYIGLASGTVQAFDVGSDILSTLHTHATAVDCVITANNLIYTKDTHGRLVVHDPRTSTEVRKFTIPKYGSATSTRRSFDISTDGKWLCSGNGSGEVCVFDALSGSLLATLSDRSRGVVWASAFSHDAQNIVYTTDNGTVWRWDMPTQVATVAGAVIVDTAGAAQDDA